MIILTLIFEGCDNYEIYKNKPVEEVDHLINQRLEVKHPNLTRIFEHLHEIDQTQMEMMEEFVKPQKNIQ